MYLSREFFLQIWNGHVQQLRRLLPWIPWGLFCHLLNIILILHFTILVLIMMMITRQTLVLCDHMAWQPLGSLRGQGRQLRWILMMIWISEDWRKLCCRYMHENINFFLVGVGVGVGWGPFVSFYCQPQAWASFVAENTWKLHTSFTQCAFLFIEI